MLHTFVRKLGSSQRYSRCERQSQALWLRHATLKKIKSFALNKPKDFTISTKLHIPRNSVKIATLLLNNQSHKPSKVIPFANEITPNLNLPPPLASSMKRKCIVTNL
jgi:hypothetical protein